MTARTVLALALLSARVANRSDRCELHITLRSSHSSLAKVIESSGSGPVLVGVARTPGLYYLHIATRCAGATYAAQLSATPATGTVSQDPVIAVGSYGMPSVRTSLAQHDQDCFQDGEIVTTDYTRLENVARALRHAPKSERGRLEQEESAANAKLRAAEDTVKRLRCPPL